MPTKSRPIAAATYLWGVPISASKFEAHLTTFPYNSAKAMGKRLCFLHDVNIQFMTVVDSERYPRKCKNCIAALKVHAKAIHVLLTDRPNFKTVKQVEAAYDNAQFENRKRKDKTHEGESAFLHA